MALELLEPGEAGQEVSHDATKFSQIALHDMWLQPSEERFDFTPVPVHEAGDVGFVNRYSVKLALPVKGGQRVEFEQDQTLRRGGRKWGQALAWDIVGVDIASPDPQVLEPEARVKQRRRADAKAENKAMLAGVKGPPRVPPDCCSSRWLPALQGRAMVAFSGVPLVHILADFVCDGVGVVVLLGGGDGRSGLARLRPGEKSVVQTAWPAGTLTA